MHFDCALGKSRTIFIYIIFSTKASGNWIDMETSTNTLAHTHTHPQNAICLCLALNGSVASFGLLFFLCVLAKQKIQFQYEWHLKTIDKLNC